MELGDNYVTDREKQGQLWLLKMISFKLPSSGFCFTQILRIIIGVFFFFFLFALTYGERVKAEDIIVIIIIIVPHTC